jgi:hypothetical protein
MADSPIYDAASLYDALGLPVILTDANKNPGLVGEDWYNFEWNDATFRRWLGRHPDAQLGLRLWPLVDIEIDAPLDDDGTFLAAAEAEHRQLTGGGVTVAWSSRRGKHFLYEATPEQQAALLKVECPAVLKSAFLEMRIGATKQLQSLIPPSTTDGVKREWLHEPGEAPIAELPNALFQYMLSEANARRAKKFQSPSQARDDRPGDVYNAKVSWREILEPHGWKHVRGDEGGVQQWTRPGKTEGISATSGYCGSDARPDCFYCFSSAAEIEPFEPHRTYSKFEAYATLEFDGDFRAASADVAKQGYVQDVDGSEFGDIEYDEPPIVAGLVKSDVPIEPPAPPTIGSLPDFVFDNPIGEYVLANDPHTEADKDAVYMQAFEIFANFIGTNLSFRINNTVLHTNGFLMIVGNTALARKGTSYNDAAEPFLSHADTVGYMESRVVKGVSTGEGIVSYVADKDGNTEGRLLLYLPEFHKVMTLLKRPENILSPLLREAYDGMKLSIPTKTNPLTASAAHISIVSHTTAGEFSRTASTVDFVNGLFNRMCFVWVSDGKVLPNPGRVSELATKNLAIKLAEVKDWVDNGGVGRELAWSYAAEAFWTDYYRSIRVASGDEFIDALIARAPVHVIKHAMRQAALDCSETIELIHLERAIAIWDRCRESAVRLVKTRNPDMDDRDRLLQAILDKGSMTRTECYDLFRGTRMATDVNGFIDYWVAEGKLARGKAKRKDGSAEVLSAPKQQTSKLEKVK